jgi:predicted RNA-binding Zn-ribbon protein involved in translation (DUF1610 family)
MRKLTQEEFLQKARAVHGDKYNYSEAKYDGLTKEVTIICSIHGRFEQRAGDHIQAHGCPRCGIIIRTQARSMGVNKFVKRANRVHQDKYNYSKVKYVGRNTEIEIVCPIHGSFFQIPHNHLQGSGCPKCAIISRAKDQTLDTKQFIERANLIHRGRYNYSKVKYVGCYIEVEIICPVHKSFFQKPYRHLQGQGCRTCSSPRTENLVRDILERLYPLKFPKAHPKFLERLELDCYNEDYKIAIEYNGIQHYKFDPFFHRTEDAFESQQERDRRKKELCLKHGVDLFIIPYEYDYRDPIRLENYIRTLLQDVLLVL